MTKEIISATEAQKVIMRTIKGPVTRKELIEKCVKTQKLTPEELKDKRSGEKLNKYKCEFGKAIQKLIAVKSLQQNDDLISKVKELKQRTPQEVEAEIDNDQKIEEILLSALEEKNRKKSELLQLAIQKCKNGKFKIKDPKSDAGRILSVLLKEEKIFKTDDIYSIKKRTNEALLHIISPEEFVSHSVKMLKKWYKRFNGYDKTVGQVTDGPNDGGIDGIITGEDKIGFAHRIILQMKHKGDNSKNVQLSEVCAFCGVLSSDDATKGLFVTNAKFHKDTVNFAKKYKTKYFVLIDGEKWLKLAKECDYEIDKQETE